MFPKTVFSGDNINEEHQHWTNFEKYFTTQWKHTLASRDELCEAFLLTLSGTAYYWFQSICHNITNTHDLQISFLKKFNKWGDTERDLNHAWNKLQFSTALYTVQEFKQELDLLAALMGTTDAQIIEKFKECFPPEIEYKLLDINDLDRLVTKSNQLVQLFKSKQAMSSSLLSHLAQQQQLSQRMMPITQTEKEYKFPIGSKWSNNQQKNRS